MLAAEPGDCKPTAQVTKRLVIALQVELSPAEPDKDIETPAELLVA